MSHDHSNDASELTDDERAQIDHYFNLRTNATFYELLGVPPSSNRRVIRDAYFELSKRFHPDVFFKRDLGAYRTRLDDVFRAFTKAYDVLGNPKQRSGYDLLIGNMGEGGSLPPPAPSPPVAMPSIAPGMETPTREVIEVPFDAVDEPWSGSDPVGASQSALKSTPPSATDSTPPVSPQPRVQAPLTRSQPPMASGDVPVTPQAPVPAPMTRAPRNYIQDETSARALVPPPMRSSTQPGAPLPSRVAPGGMSQADLAARARAMEAMARRLSGTSSATGSRPPSDVVIPSGGFPKPGPPDLEAIAAERRAQAEHVVAQGEEAQKSGNLVKALEFYKSAAQILRDDDGVKARVEAVTNLVNMQHTNDAIEMARNAMRAGKADESSRFWEKAWEGRQSDLALLVNAADVISKHTKDHKRAIELCQKIVMHDPKNVKALAIMARTFIDAGLRASARGAIENVARLEPPNSPLVKELRDRLGPLTIAEQLGLRNR